MAVIGLVGRVGAGKSTVASLFAERGAVVADADRWAHDVLDEPEARAAVVARFGREILGSDGRIRRSELAARVLGGGEESRDALEALEAIVHPRVRERLAAAIDACAEGPVGGVVVLDVPLLLQAGWDARCDRLVLVECDDAERHRRLASRGWTPEQVAARDEAWQRGYRPPRAGLPVDVVDTTGNPAYTREQVGRIWDRVIG